MTRPFPILQTAGLLLRAFEEMDLDYVFQGLSNPEVIKYYGVHYDSRESAKRQMSWFDELQNDGTGIWWAVCSPDNAIFYGAGGLNNLNKEHKKAEIGFWLMPGFWGQGLMIKVIPLIVDFGFQILGLHRIEAMVETENENCKRVMAKLDFLHEGTLHECEIKNGKWISLDLYAKINRADKR
jgi:[ribosomal protein S5]-alanine N-acetyltransferase